MTVNVTNCGSVSGRPSTILKFLCRAGMLEMSDDCLDDEKATQMLRFIARDNTQITITEER